MKIAPISVATKVSGWKTSSAAASAVPTSTGATAAGSVRGRAAISQMRTEPPMRSRYGRRGNFAKSGARLSL